MTVQMIVLIVMNLLDWTYNAKDHSILSMCIVHTFATGHQIMIMTQCPPNTTQDFQRPYLYSLGPP